MPLLNQVNLVVRDPDASWAFFALLGIELGQAYEWPPGSGAYDAFWGARYAIVEDPDGHTVGLMGPIDRTRGYIPSGPPS